ncbi:MAG: HAMP domain-containing protein [Treponema sp.]|jgi:HPt (histidine-containing phosphotransfer) domain-containing protein/HAMP domain-containing protein|nr:HAMP domain-containing protein [Treponema sp.]
MVIPFLVIYLAFSAVLIRQAYQSKIEETRQDLYNLGNYYRLNLNSFYEAAELSVLVSAAELEAIETTDPKSRGIGENVLIRRFHNPHVINAWLVFEPDAFDGRDALHTGDYPGAPSGRYIRSFNRQGNSWEVAEDIDESMLDDVSTGYWYTIPRDSGTIFTDLGGYDLLWDYGDDPVSSIGVVAPVFRDDRVIGCVGVDLEMNEKILGEQYFFNVDVDTAIFLFDGRLGYSLDTDNVGKTLEDLGFESASRIRKAMENRASLFLYNEWSGISGTKNFSYFCPLFVAGRFIYIYIAFPQNYVWRNVIPVLRPIVISVIASLILFSLLLLYLFRGISKPIQKLTLTSEAIASGDLDVRIEYKRSEDELGMITKSLSRIVEQFKVSKLLQRRNEDRFDIIMDIHYALFRGESLGAAFDATLKAVAEYFCVFKAALVFIPEESPRIVAVYPPSDSEEGDSGFFSHDQIVNLIGDKKHLTMNYGTMSSMKLSFVDFAAKSLCILPLRVKDLLKGYIIMEGREDESLVHDDTTLLFISDTLAYLLDSRINWAPETTGGSSVPAETAKAAFVQEDNADTFLEKAKTIQYLNVDKGLFLLGGEKDQYTELLRITIKVIGEKIPVMRGLYAKNIAAFGIEVHGMKAALYNIGAESLGDRARQLEFAAKSGDNAYCREHYREFEEQLEILSQNIASLFPREERGSQPGNLAELETILGKILEACNVFDNSGAQVFLNQVNGLRWEDGQIEEALRKIGDDIENLEYEQAAEKIEELLYYMRSIRE